MRRHHEIDNRALEPVLRSLPPEAARQITRAEADGKLPQRVEELTCKANEGTLTPEERSEYEAVARKALQAVTS